MLVVLAPCLPLLELNQTFAIDWPNQIWMINYVSSYLAANHSFPSVINTIQLIGMPFPVFYGYLFFPLFGMLSLLWNGDLTVRLLAAALYALQFILLFQVCLRATRKKFLSLCIGIFATWSIYPMTNLYNRGAIPEFFATGLLTCACLIWLTVLRLESSSKPTILILCNLFVFLFVLAAGTHPITALYGACFLALFVGLSLWVARLDPRQFLLPLLIPCILGIICLLPWVMATVQFAPRTQISNSFHRVGYFSRSLDSVKTRLLPFPIDTRSYEHRLKDDNVGTRYLDAQICFPLLVLFIFCFANAFKNRAQISKPLIVSLVILGTLAAAMIWSSTTIGSLDKVGRWFRTIQFAYRLITYINLSLLGGILLFLSYGPKAKNLAVIGRPLLGVLLVLSGIGLCVKLYHAQLITTETPLNLVRTTEFANGLLTMPASFYGWDGYAVTDTLPEFSADDLKTSHAITFLPDQNHFGDVQPLNLEKGRYATNLQAFPWNHVATDNGEVGRYFYTPPGDHKTAIKLAMPAIVNFKFVPDQLWAGLNCLALIVFFLWMIGTILLAFLLKKKEPHVVLPETNRLEIKSSI